MKIILSYIGEWKPYSHRDGDMYKPRIAGSYQTLEKAQNSTTKLAAAQPCRCLEFRLLAPEILENKILLFRTIQFCY